MVASPTDSRRWVRSLTCTRISAAWLAAAAVSIGALSAERQEPQALGRRPDTAAPSPSGLGRPPTQAELRVWDISIGPNGAELPPGRGDAVQGALVFTQRGCAGCHGPTGIEGPAPVLIGGKPTLSTNYFPIAYWPFAPPIWDYINRAMPYDRPGHLTANEVYALVAFLLHRNGIIGEGEVMDAQSLPKVQMPHRAAYKGPSPWSPDTPRDFRILPEAHGQSGAPAPRP